MTFPPLVPSTRTYSPGDVTQVRQVSLSGINAGYRRSDRRVDQSLQLSFNNINESQLNEIRNHYIAQDGTYNIFFLPQQIWSGYTTVPIPSPSNVAWRYASPPIITDGSCDLWSVEVELRSYVIEAGDIDIGLPGPGADPNPVVVYIYDGLSAAATPARDYVIDSGASR